MFDQSAEVFEGGMSAKKYISITKNSKATAKRDLQDLVEKSVLTPKVLDVLWDMSWICKQKSRFYWLIY